MALSLPNPPKRFNQSMIRMAKTPKTLAPISIQKELISPDIRNAITIPGKTEWDRASPIKLIFLSTKKLPSKLEFIAMMQAVNMIQKSNINFLFPINYTNHPFLPLIFL